MQRRIQVRPPFDQLFDQGLDTVITGFHEYRPCWIKKKGDFLRIDDHAKLRGEREALHIGLLSLGCVTYPEFIRKGTRLGEKIGIYEIKDPIAAIEIRRPKDLVFMEKLKQFLPQEIM